MKDLRIEGGGLCWTKVGVWHEKRGRIHHRSKSGIITERFITRGHRSVMPIHACEAVFEYPADVYLYILTRVISREVFQPWPWAVLECSHEDRCWISRNENSLLREMHARCISLKFLLLYIMIEFHRNILNKCFLTIICIANINKFKYLHFFGNR